MGSKTKAPKTKLNASDAVNGVVEAATTLLVRNAERILDYAKKSEEKTVAIKLVGTMDISGGNPQVEFQLDVERKEKFKDNIVGELDSNQGKFTEILNEAGGKGESAEPKGEEEDAN